MMIAEQVRQSYGRTQFVYNTTEGSVLVVLTLDKGTEAEQVQMCRQTEALHGLLEMDGTADSQRTFYAAGTAFLCILAGAQHGRLFRPHTKGMLSERRKPCPCNDNRYHQSGTAE